MPAFDSYKNPALAVDIVLFGYDGDALQVLLLNRNEEPFKNRWTLPGAFLGVQETFGEACARVLRHKLGLGKTFVEQLYTYDDPARDPRGRVVSVAHYALINPASVAVVAGAMANDVKWFPVQRVPALGFDHKAIFRQALQRLRSKLLYQPVGFELLDDRFTMPELHRLYENILEIEIDRRNFSRKILESGFVIPTGEKRTGGANRRPDLYRFNAKLRQHALHLNFSKP